jgi:branched-chain amino acid transport system ATP-binding protein
MLNIEDLYADYGRGPVLTGLSLHVEPGEFVALVGNNAAGKTTLFRTISGLHGIKSGRVELNGKPVRNHAPDVLARAGLGHVPEGRRVFGSLSVEDNLLVGGVATAPRDRARTKRDIYLMFPKLERRARQRAGTLSGGEQQMLAIGRALMAHPHLLLLDEPSLGLAPTIANEVVAILGRIRNDWACTVVLAEQSDRLLKGKVDRILQLQGGAVHTISDSTHIGAAGAV